MGIGIDAGKTEGERRIGVAADITQPVEHGLAGGERHVEAFGLVRLAGGAALDEKGRIHADALASSCADAALLDDSASLPWRRSII